MNFNLNFVLIALAACAAFLYFNATHNPYVSTALAILIAYMYFSKKEDSVIVITDSKQLLRYARTKPAGRSLPEYNSVPSENRQTEYYKGYWFYLFTIGVIRKGFALDTIITHDRPVITKVFSVGVNDLAISDWRTMVKEDAFQTNEKKTESEMVDELRKKGYQVRYRGKDAEDDDEEED